MSIMTCPQCGQRMTLDFNTNRVSCSHCGYIRPDEISTLEQKEHEVKQHPVAQAVDIIFKEEINTHAWVAFESGQDAIVKGDKVTAFANFKRASDIQFDFTDAHLWMAKTTDDPK